MEHLHLIRDETMREVVRRIAQNDPTMTELDDIDDIDEFDADLCLALGHALMTGNTCLEELRLPNIVLTEATANALAQGMARSKIEKLTLHESLHQQASQKEHDESPLGHICDIFYRGIQASSTIQNLYLNQSMSEDLGEAWKGALLGVTSITIGRLLGEGYAQALCKVMSQATLLDDLTVWIGEVEPDDITTLARGICQNTSITSLGLFNEHGHSDPDSNEHAKLVLLEGLSPDSSITKFEAYVCSVDDGCIDLLIDRWLPNCPMEYLILHRNKIGLGAHRLVHALANHPTMLALDLSYNAVIGYEGLRLIGNEVANLYWLAHLNLHACSVWTDFTDTESKEAQAQTRARQQAIQALLDGMKRNISITDLKVSGNSFPECAENEMHFYAAVNRVGHYLLSAERDRGVAPSVWCHIFVKCQQQPVFGTGLMYFFLKELPTLVQSRPMLKRKKIS